VSSVLSYARIEAGFTFQFTWLGLDRRTGNLIMLAGEETEIEIRPDGQWDYVP